MARSFTLTLLATKVRARADQQGTYIGDTELFEYISSAYCEVYEILIRSGLAFFESTQTITSDGTGAVAVPADYMGTIGVDYQYDSQHWIALRPLRAPERNKYPNSNTSRAYAYRVAGATLNMYPAPPNGQTYRHIYVPAPVDLTSGSQTVDGVSGWEELIVLIAHQRCLLKEESDDSQVAAEIGRQMARINDAVQMRELKEVGKVIDIDDLEEWDPANYRY